MFRRRKPDSDPVSQPVLPTDVRFALRYRNARLSPKDIEALFNNGMANLGFYMTMKATETDDALQAGLIDRARSKGFDMSRLGGSDIAPALEYLGSQAVPYAKGDKLASVNRYGVDVWKGRFATVLGPILRNNPDSPLYVVANAPYIGLDELAGLTLEQGRSLNVLKPDRFGQAELPVGFTVEPGSDGDIVSLSADFDRPPGAIVFDDTLRLGGVRDQVMEFWGQVPSGPPDFVAAFEVRV